MVSQHTHVLWGVSLSLCRLLIVFLIPLGCRMESRILENLLCLWPSFIYNWGRIDL